MRKSIFLYSLLITVLFLSTGSLYGECSDSEMGKTSDNFPGGVSPESILSIIGISPQICGIAMKKWPYQDSIFIVYAEDTMDYHIYILKQTGKVFKVVSQYQEEFGEFDYRFRSFDFAPYKINKDQTAFGIRFFINGATMGGRWECEKLVLYERTDNEINPILSTVVYYQAEGNNVAYDTDSSFYWEEKGVIIIGQPDKSGYNRIIEKVGKKKYVFTYDSGHYTSDSMPNCLNDSVGNCFCPAEE